jgi:hypothetical protein
MDNEFEKILNELIVLKRKKYHEQSHDYFWIEKRTEPITKCLINLFHYICDEFMIEKNLSNFIFLLDLPTVHQLHKVNSLNKNYLYVLENYLPQYSFKKTLYNKENEVGMEQWLISMSYLEEVLFSFPIIKKENPFYYLNELEEKIILESKIIDSNTQLQLTKI